MAKKSKKANANTNISSLSMEVFAVSSSMFIGTETINLTAKRMSRSEKKKINQVRLIAGTGMIASTLLMTANAMFAPMPMIGDYSDMD